MPLLPGEGGGKPDERERFIDWLCFGDERIVGQSQAAFAEELGVHVKTLTKWKKDRRFKQEWQARLRETVLAPDVIADQLRVLHRIATNEGDSTKDSDRIAAITQYQKLTGAAAAERHEINAGDAAGAREMSDEDLMAELQSRVAQKALNAATD